MFIYETLPNAVIQQYVYNRPETGFKTMLQWHFNRIALRPCLVWSQSNSEVIVRCRLSPPRSFMVYQKIFRRLIM